MNNNFFEKHNVVSGDEGQKKEGVIQQERNMDQYKYVYVEVYSLLAKYYSLQEAFPLKDKNLQKELDKMVENLAESIIDSFLGFAEPRPVYKYNEQTKKYGDYVESWDEMLANFKALVAEQEQIAAKKKNGQETGEESFNRLILREKKEKLLKSLNNLKDKLLNEHVGIFANVLEEVRDDIDMANNFNINKIYQLLNALEKSNIDVIKKIFTGITDSLEKITQHGD